jgi:manganese efflux pump family protein
MGQLFLLGVLAGIDNLQVGAAISLAPLARARRILLMLAFATCEIASPLIGVLFAHEVQTRFHVSFDGIRPVVIAACGIAIVWLALREQDDDVRALINSRWTLVGLPISLSFDNLLIGISVASLGYPPALAALVIGGTSATLCVIGILAGARISRLIPKRAELVSGFALIIIAASMWIRS